MRQGTESVTEITHMFTEREMFCPEFSSEQSQMTFYLSMIKTDIRQFVATVIHYLSYRSPLGSVSWRLR